MTATVEELYAVIEEKEANLHLAAELGKALLEKNETLTKEFEQTTNSHRQQLEVRYLISVLYKWVRLILFYLGYIIKAKPCLQNGKCYAWG